MYVPPYRNEPADDAEEFEVTAICQSGQKISALQENAWNFIRDKFAEVEASLRRKLFVNHMKGYRGFVDECVPDLSEFDLEEWDEIKDAIPWDTPAAVDAMFELISIGLLDQGLDDCGFSYFNFNSGWDEEHGISVLMHRNHVLAAGGISEFSNLGDEVIPHIKSIQRYDLDDGDLSLLED
ncbi:DUF6985 domain-containing protein [Blastopirellula marina]|uniref:DUF6985 domain-containing protein n=1 Tax=Blastopirellula marina TaxID=124 RepID=A0A2S8G246_9BACT|nr:hypothetical protein [Blastopirellula marina]PQO38380.1 hypothetical protein C5Y98_09970 [Blastopirellula marina]PTL45037.1 hypothetical protein C5Y97_09980 [Blastopirellula marina]